MRRKKDAKRTAMMQAAVQVFSEKGYHAATVRDIVQAADVAIGTFYFYFPDKETLFLYLYEETADFLVQAVQQGVSGRAKLTEQIAHGVQSYVNIALYEPTVVFLLLVGGVGAVPSLSAKREQFREAMIRIWQRPLDHALDQGLIPTQNTRRAAEAITGACDEVILNLLQNPRGENEAPAAIKDLSFFILRGLGALGSPAADK
ncbi:MAG: TetR/AcrR family transcriptional regulator [Ardenticatenaceae bacterium]|nr:TetR/AcrR family transcriptional regulator [Ardenticatenaceae bacterium]